MKFCQPSSRKLFLMTVFQAPLSANITMLIFTLEYRQIDFSLADACFFCFCTNENSTHYDPPKCVDFSFHKIFFSQFSFGVNATKMCADSLFGRNRCSISYSVEMGVWGRPGEASPGGSSQRVEKGTPREPISAPDPKFSYPSEVF